jgi:hypothetical protein
MGRPTRSEAHLDPSPPCLEVSRHSAVGNFNEWPPDPPTAGLRHGAGSQGTVTPPSLCTLILPRWQHYQSPAERFSITLVRVHRGSPMRIPKRRAAAEPVALWVISTG